MMRYETTIDIDAPPGTVWSVMRDVERWHEWTASVSGVRLVGGGPIRVGSQARVQQPKLPPADWTVTELVEGRGFTWVTRSPGIRVTGRHDIEPLGAGSRATLSILYEGSIGPVLGRLLRRINERYIALEAAGLKRRSEELQRTGP